MSISPKKLIKNELIREIVSIRVDTLWKMLALKREGFLPSPNEEGATGKLDNKGAIFIPGGLIYQDVDERPIRYQSHETMSPELFRQKVRDAMRFDNATLLRPDGMASGIHLDSGFLSKAARRIYTFKKAAFRRKTKIGLPKHIEVETDDVIRSHCPNYLPQPYGARTRVSTAAAVGLVDPPMFFAYCETQFSFSEKQSRYFANMLDLAQDSAKTEDGAVLYPPFIVVCHDTRYKEASLTGLTRILGIGAFGEFATITFEVVNKSLIAEIKRKQQSLSEEEIFATLGDVQVLGILRIYAATNPGKRSMRYDLHILSPSKYLDLDLDQIRAKAWKRYQITKI